MTQFKAGDKVKVAEGATFRLAFRGGKCPVVPGIVGKEVYIIDGPDPEGDYDVAFDPNDGASEVVSPEFLTLVEDEKDDSPLVRWNANGDEVHFVTDVDDTWMVIQCTAAENDPEIVRRSEWLSYSTTAPLQVPEGWVVDPTRRGLTFKNKDVFAFPTEIGIGIVVNGQHALLSDKVLAYLQAERERMKNG